MPCVPGVVEYKTAYIMQVGLSISHHLRAAREQTISYSPKSVEEQVADLLVAVAVAAVSVIVGGCRVGRR